MSNVPSTVYWDETFRLEPILNGSRIYLQIFDEILSHEKLIGITDPIVLVDFPEGVSNMGLLVYDEN